MRHIFGCFGSFFAILALLVWGCTTAETERNDPESSSADTDSDADSDADTDTDIDTDSDTDTDTDTDSDADTESNADRSCHLGDELTAPIDVLRLPCLPGRTTIMGVFEGSSICEDHETKSFSLFQISPPHDLTITFGELGELHATWDKDILHDSEGAIDVTVTLPQNSSLPSKTLWGGFGSILRTPVAFEENYRMVLKSIKDSSDGLVTNDEIGICVIQ